MFWRFITWAFANACSLEVAAKVIERLWKEVNNMADTTTTSTADIRTNAELQLLELGVNTIINHPAGQDVKATALQIILGAFLTYLQAKTAK